MGNPKRYILDTNVLIRDPQAPYAFEDNHVCITTATLEELDNLKSRPGDVGYNAREAIRIIEQIRNGHSFKTPVSMPMGGTFGIVPCSTAPLPREWDDTKPDNRIIATVQELGAILVTADIAMLLKADQFGIPVQKYRHEQVDDSTFTHTGRTTLYTTSESINKFYQQKKLSLDELWYENGEPVDPANPKLFINEFIILKASESQSACGYFTGHSIAKLRHEHIHPMGVTPRNLGQKFALDALLRPALEVPLVILTGPAGTAKTFLALAAGLHNIMLNDSPYRKMLLLRPNTKFDEDIGYLKGTEMDKIMPLMRPYLDNLEELLPNDEFGCDKPSFSRIDEYFANGLIAAEALAYLRGRSIHRSYIICDEAQNSTPNQMKGILTRAGIDSKIVIMGDPEQIDNPRLDKRNNGLVYASEKMLGKPLCMQFHFNSAECVRSPLAELASKIL